MAENLARRDALTRAEAARREQRLAAEGLQQAEPDTPFESEQPAEEELSSGDPPEATEPAPDENADSEPEELADSSEGDLDFAGSYRGTDVVDLRLSGVAPQEQTDPNALLEVEQTGSEVRLTIVDSSNGNDLCRVLADATGPSATVRAAQPCFEPERSGMSFIVNSGSLVLSGDHLTLDLFGDAELPALSASGTLSYSFEGDR